MEKVRERHTQEHLKLKRDFEMMHSKTMKVDLIDGQLRVIGESPEPNNNDPDFS